MERGRNLAKRQEKSIRVTKKLKYVPNFNAKNLMTKDAKSIGILVPNIGIFDG